MLQNFIRLRVAVPSAFAPLRSLSRQAICNNAGLIARPLRLVTPLLDGVGRTHLMRGIGSHLLTVQHTRTCFSVAHSVPTCFYKVLGVAEKAPTAEIKNAYHKLALQCHPDQNGTQSAQVQREGEERFKSASEAYTVLSCPAQRQQYDAQRAFGGGKPFSGNTPQKQQPQQTWRQEQQSERSNSWNPFCFWGFAVYCFKFGVPVAFGFALYCFLGFAFRTFVR